MKQKRILAFLLSIALLLGCVKFGPMQTAFAADAPHKDEAQHEPEEEEQTPKYVDPEQFGKEDHVQRLHDEERLDTYVFLNRDGSKSVYYMGRNVKYKDRDGKVRDKDTTLIRGERGYRMRDNDVELHIPDSAADGITVGYGVRSIKLLPMGGSGRASLEDNSITYDGYFGAETALRYTPLLSGVKEDIILSSYTGQSSFTFDLETGGLYLYHENGQYYLAESETAEAAFYLGQVVIYDAVGRPDDGSMTAEVIIPGQQYRLTLSADVEFLTDPETVYPVTIDPTLTVSYTTHGVNAIIDAPIYEGYPSKNYGSYVYDRVGYYDDDYQTARTVMRLDALLNSAEWQGLEEDDIIGLTLYIKEGSNKSAKTVNLHALTENSTWTESSIKWNNVGAYSSTIYATASLGKKAWAEFDLTTLATAWKTGAQNAHCGFLLKLADESVYRTIYSCEYSTVDYRPYVVLTYESDASLNCTTKDIDEGDSFTLTASAQLGIDGDVSWTSDNEDVATVSTGGVVTGVKAGKATITAVFSDIAGNSYSRSCTVYVTIADGIYYIKNAASGLCLQATVDNTYMYSQKTSQSTRLNQLWKITHITNGRYVIRPLQDTSVIMTISSGGYVAVADALTSDESVATASRWSIVHDDTGYAFMLAGSEAQAVIPVVTGMSGAQVYATTLTSSAACHWTLEEAEGVFLRDTTTLEIINSSIERCVELGQTYTLADLRLCWECYGCYIDVPAWSCDDYSIASVNSSGTVKAVSYGHVVITLSATIEDIPYLSSVSVFVSPLPDGTYRIENRATGMMVDIENQAMNANSTIHQWETHIGYSQAWTITHLGDGLYSIHSRNAETNYYLGIKGDSSSINQPVVLRTGSLTNGMKWRIASTDNGAFKLIPLSGESGGCVLATSTSDKTNGAILIQGEYINNTSYRDEWYLHSAKYAYSIGGQFNNGQDAINAAENWSYCGYISDYNINPTTSILSYNRLNSEIVYFSTHGNQHMLSLLNNIFLTDGLTSTSSNTVEISDYSLPDARLYIYDACKTASNTDGTDRNLCTETIAAGAETVIGWTESIYVDDATLWQTRFQSLLAGGATVIDAANFANTFIYESNTTIKSWRVYGNENLNVCQNPNSNTYTSPDTVTLKYTNIDYPSHDETNLKLILAGEFPSFSNEEAVIVITYTNDQQTNYVIDYVYYYNGYVTDSGYSIIVQNGIITHMRDNTNTNAVNLQTASAALGSVVPEVTEAVIQSAFAQATAEVTVIDADYSIIEQRTDKYYDIVTGKYYYRIISVYVTPDDTYGAICTKYELQNQE